MNPSPPDLETLWALPLPELIARADEVRRRRVGDGVWLRGLLEFTNRCTQGCAYCGIRGSNGRAVRYSLTEDQIEATVRRGWDRGFRTFVLQGGEDPDWATDRLCRLAERLRIILGDQGALTLSCGIKSREDYRRLAEAGANRYLLRFETSDPELFSRLKPGQTLARRLEALQDLRDGGFEVGSGFLVGLPGETEETRRENLRLCASLRLHMVGIGPFLPHPDTPLAGAQPGSMEDTVRLVALLRLLLPEANIPATTAAGSRDAGGREAMLAAGANVLMPNLTPPGAREHYTLYPGKVALVRDGAEDLEELLAHLHSLGRKGLLERGDSLAFLRDQVSREPTL